MIHFKSVLWPELIGKEHLKPCPGKHLYGRLSTEWVTLWNMETWRRCRSGEPSPKFCSMKKLRSLKKERKKKCTFTLSWVFSPRPGKEEFTECCQPLTHIPRSSSQHLAQKFHMLGFVGFVGTEHPDALGDSWGGSDTSWPPLCCKQQWLWEGKFSDWSDCSLGPQTPLLHPQSKGYLPSSYNIVLSAPPTEPASSAPGRLHRQHSGTPGWARRNWALGYHFYTAGLIQSSEVWDVKVTKCPSRGCPTWPAHPNSLPLLRLHLAFFFFPSLIANRTNCLPVLILKLYLVTDARSSSQQGEFLPTLDISTALAPKEVHGLGAWTQVSLNFVKVDMNIL